VTVIKTIAIIGANATGQAFAAASARAGYPTILEDVSREMLERGISAIASQLQHAVERAELSAENRAAALAHILSVIGVENAIRDADLLIEAVPEELEMKLELFTIFDKFAKPGAIFASTTATLSVLDLSDVTVYRERCIGMRFAASPSSRHCIELVRTRLTSEETASLCQAVAGRMAKEVRFVPDIKSESPE
jgi:3-hydroxyacyl-CoA dehydrogenase